MKRSVESSKSVALLLESVLFNHRFIIFNYELHKFYELGEPWRLLGNHPDGAFAKKAKNSFNWLRRAEGSYNWLRRAKGSWSRKSV